MPSESSSFNHTEFKMYLRARRVCFLSGRAAAEFVEMLSKFAVQTPRTSWAVEGFSDATFEQLWRVLWQPYYLNRA